LIMGLENAQCLFQDLYGRVGVLQFDAVFGDIIDIFSTTPVDASELKEEAEIPAEIPKEKVLVTVGAVTADEEADEELDLDF